MVLIWSHLEKHTLLTERVARVFGNCCESVRSWKVYERRKNRTAKGDGEGAERLKAEGTERSHAVGAEGTERSHAVGAVRTE